MSNITWNLKVDDTLYPLMASVDNPLHDLINNHPTLDTLLSANASVGLTLGNKTGNDLRLQLIPSRPLTSEELAYINQTTGSPCISIDETTGVISICLAPAQIIIPPPGISCDGATTETGVFELSGAFDVELNGQVVATNLEPQALVDYLNGTGDLRVDVIHETSTISCDGATNTAWFTDGSGTWDVEVNGALYENPQDWGLGYFVNQVPALSEMLDVAGDGDCIITSKVTDQSLRVKLIRRSIDRWEINEANENPTIIISEEGDISFCLAPAVTEEFPDDPLMFHISNLDDGGIIVVFEGVPIGSKLRVDWGDGSPVEEIISEAGEDLMPSHSYTSVDHIAKFAIDNPVDYMYLTSTDIDGVVSFGSAVQVKKIELNNMYNLVSVPSTLPAYIREISFNNSHSLNDPNISLWDVSNLISMKDMFRYCISFNQPLNNWNVSNVTDMTRMFYGAGVFNQDLSMWCVSKIVSEPTYFSQDATSYTLPKPVWGTCPTYIWRSTGNSKFQIVDDPLDQSTATQVCKIELGDTTWCGETVAIQESESVWRCTGTTYPLNVLGDIARHINTINGTFRNYYVYESTGIDATDATSAKAAVQAYFNTFNDGVVRIIEYASYNDLNNINQINVFWHFQGHPDGSGVMAFTKI